MLACNRIMRSWGWLDHPRSARGKVVRIPNENLGLVPGQMDETSGDTSVLEQPIAKGRRERQSRETMNPKFHRAPSQSQVGEAMLGAIDEGVEAVTGSSIMRRMASDASAPVHDDVKPAMRNPVPDDESPVARLSKGRKERESRDEVNVKLHRGPPSRANEVE